MNGHGYNPYAHGCRCEVCRAAKAAYVRAKRAAARERARGPLIVKDGPNELRNYVPGIKHGTAGYKDHLCRCEVCTASQAAEDARRKAARNPAPPA
jgi:hypothetical protein